MVSKKTKAASFNERVKEYRLSRHWTLQRMANLTGLHVNTLHRIEKGYSVHELTERIVRDTLPGFEDES